MKKRRFYNNKGRAKKWTEQPVGRKISFADKYAPDSLNIHTEENEKSHKRKRPFITPSKRDSILRGLIVTVASFFIISVGYTIMDIHLERNAMPLEKADSSSDTADMNNVIVIARGTSCQPLSLDGSIMLDAVIENTFDEGYSAIAFDIKRNDGTIGYESRLATISSFGAISSPSSNLSASVQRLNENDILPIGIISCYKDNIVPYADMSSAVFDNGSLYTDSGSNTYLNPDVDSTYNYIKSIVDEAMGLGVNMFILDSYELPSDISDNYNDGFEPLAQRLYADFGSELKLFRAVDLYISIDEDNPTEDIWSEKTKNIDLSDNNIMLCIATNDPEALKQFLNSRDVNNYIIMK